MTSTTEIQRRSEAATVAQIVRCSSASQRNRAMHSTIIGTAFTLNDNRLYLEEKALLDAVRRWLCYRTLDNERHVIDAAWGWSRAEDSRETARKERSKSMPWIQTEKGNRFDLVTPNPAQVDVEEIAAALAKICRFNGHSRDFYSVAQHSVIVADMLPADVRAYGLFHDAHEAYVGDLATPVKELLQQGWGDINPWNSMVKRIDKAIFDAVGLQWPMPVDIARQVKHADLVALATERRDLMAEGPDWGQSMAQPLAQRIVPWGWEKSMDIFLDRVRPCQRSNHA